MSNSALSVDLRIKTLTDNDQQNGLIMHEMNSFYFLPYVTWLQNWHRLFMQAFSSHCIQTANMDHMIGGVSHERVLDPNVIAFDVAIGYWTYGNPNTSYLSGIILTIKFHYQVQLEDEGQQAFNDLVVLHL